MGIRTNYGKKLYSLERNPQNIKLLFSETPKKQEFKNIKNAMPLYSQIAPYSKIAVTIL